MAGYDARKLLEHAEATNTMVHQLAMHALDLNGETVKPFAKSLLDCGQDILEFQADLVRSSPDVRALAEEKYPLLIEAANRRRVPGPRPEGI